MKNAKNDIVIHTIHNEKADNLFATRIPEIQEEIITFARDLATQGRPKKADSPLLFMPKIKALFETFLEQVLRLIGAFSVLTENATLIEKHFKDEEMRLQVDKKALEEDLRLVEKEAQGQEDQSHILKRWKFKWRPLLIALTVGEVAINFKILLLVTPNVLTAAIASLSLCAALFVIAHSFKDILAYFESKATKWAVGSSIILAVLLLLYGLNKLRLAFMAGADPTATENLSESGYEFVVINAVLFASGVIIAMLYKPLKTTIAEQAKFTESNTKIVKLKGDIKALKDRIDAIPDEINKRLADLHGLQCMGKHYENEAVSEYHKAHSLFVTENLYRRKDGVTAPDAFLKAPPKLTTYFDHIVEPIKKS